MVSWGVMIEPGGEFDEEWGRGVGGVEELGDMAPLHTYIGIWRKFHAKLVCFFIVF